MKTSVNISIYHVRGGQEQVREKVTGLSRERALKLVKNATNLFK